ncbi:MAG: phosphoribosyl-AMP cyclohydrolase, partial [Candidatus Omnitrophica bacterium]|nr:phosphoribosyl-AMP cyclohydrolase [Candidatus Omnitrophota bacterium]
MRFLQDLNFNDKGLIPAVIQDVDSGSVLTLCYMNREAIERTIQEKKIYVYRRSKGRLMVKGETSGCTQEVKTVLVDCAENSLLFKVKQHRAACHKGYFSCYYRKVDEDGGYAVDAERVFDPEEVYG